MSSILKKIHARAEAYVWWPSLTRSRRPRGWNKAGYRGRAQLEAARIENAQRIAAGLPPLRISR